MIENQKKLSHNLNIFFKNIESKALINSISKKIAISSGSACTTQIVEPSHVLIALSHDETRAHSSIRIGLGRFNSQDEIDFCTKEICFHIQNLSKIKI